MSKRIGEARERDDLCPQTAIIEFELYVASQQQVTVQVVLGADCYRARISPHVNIGYESMSALLMASNCFSIIMSRSIPFAGHLVAHRAGRSIRAGGWGMA